jgi:hypothetical protein
MKKQDLQKLALLGLFSGLILTQQAQAESNTKESPLQDAAAGNMGYFLMTEDDLMLEVNQENWDLFQSLSPEGKKLALKVASQRCNNTNECKGLNACKTDSNECAGKGGCKGTSKCAFADKNLAVKVVADQMAKKRKGLTN